MPRDDNPKKPIPPITTDLPFSPEAQKELIREQVNQMIDEVAKEAVLKVLRERGIVNVYEQPAIELPPPSPPGGPRPYTREESIEMIVKGFVDNARYWANEPNAGTLEDRCQGVAFSNLVFLDGMRGNGIPPVNMYFDPGEDYVNDCIENGENWHDPDLVISTMLHDEFYPVMRKYYGEDAGGVRGPELTPQQMREEFIGTIYRIAEGIGSFTKEKGACQEVARAILMLIDGEYTPAMPPFMLFAAPSREFDQQMVDQGKPRWASHIPLNRKAPTYGVEDSLVQTYDEVRDRQARAARDMFK
jgi:hypothetical protein